MTVYVYARMRVGMYEYVRLYQLAVDPESHLLYHRVLGIKIIVQGHIYLVPTGHHVNIS